MIKFIDYINKPLLDHLVNRQVYLVQLAIGDYLRIIDLKENPYQRNVLNYEVYRKLIRDILAGAIFPPIAVVFSGKVDLSAGFADSAKLMVLDGLQRTNCLIVCKQILAGDIDTKKIKDIKSIYKDLDAFLKRVITIEIWEELDLRAILYKIIVLNTGQKRMDIRHQLDIMINSLKGFLEKNGIKFIEIKTKIEDDIKSSELQTQNIFPLHIIAEGIVAYINRYPQFTQKSTADFFFDKLDLDPGGYNEGIKLIEDESTYSDLVWVLKDFSSKLMAKYKYNVLIKYPLFFSGFMAAMGYTKSEFGIDHLRKKKNALISKFNNKDQDPLDLQSYKQYYKEFVSAIGAKRRKLVYTVFRNFFVNAVTDKIDWYIAFKEVK